MEDAVGAPCWSSVTPLPLRTWAEAGRITITPACGTNPPRAGVLELCPSPRLFLRAPSSVYMPWTLGPAALGELWSVLCSRGGTSCSWLSPARPSQPAVCSHGALGTCSAKPLPPTGTPGGKSWGFQQRKFPNQRALWQKTLSPAFSVKFMNKREYS